MNLIIRKKGFTLLELLIVIVIVAVFLSLVLPFASDLAGKRHIENATIQFQQDLLLLQNLSITHGTNDKFKITFLDNYSYKFKKMKTLQTLLLGIFPWT
ncbi:MAG: prepilin-type N-terminal cleavage/methylation domain-containing protein [Caldisericaceae bacterium]